GRELCLLRRIAVLLRAMDRLRCGRKASLPCVFAEGQAGLRGVAMRRRRCKRRPYSGRNAPHSSWLFRRFERAQSLKDHFAKRGGIFALHHGCELRTLRRITREIRAVNVIEHSRTLRGSTRFFRLRKHFAVGGRFPFRALCAFPESARVSAALR